MTDETLANEISDDTESEDTQTESQKVLNQEGAFESPDNSVDNPGVGFYRKPAPYVPPQALVEEASRIGVPRSNTNMVEPGGVNLDEDAAPSVVTENQSP